AGVHLLVGGAADRAGSGHPARVEADDVEASGHLVGQPAEEGTEGQVDGGVDAGGAGAAGVEHQRPNPILLLVAADPDERDVERVGALRVGPVLWNGEGGALVTHMRGSGADQLLGYLWTGPPGHLTIGAPVEQGTTGDQQGRGEEDRGQHDRQDAVHTQTLLPACQYLIDIEADGSLQLPV